MEAFSLMLKKFFKQAKRLQLWLRLQLPLRPRGSGGGSRPHRLSLPNLAQSLPYVRCPQTRTVTGFTFFTASIYTSTEACNRLRNC